VTGIEDEAITLTFDLETSRPFSIVLFLMDETFPKRCIANGNACWRWKSAALPPTMPKSSRVSRQRPSAPAVVNPTLFSIDHAKSASQRRTPDVTLNLVPTPIAIEASKESSSSRQSTRIAHRETAIYQTHPSLSTPKRQENRSKCSASTLVRRLAMQLFSTRKFTRSSSNHPRIAVLILALFCAICTSLRGTERNLKYSTAILTTTDLNRVQSSILDAFREVEDSASAGYNAAVDRYNARQRDRTVSFSAPNHAVPVNADNKASDSNTSADDAVSTGSLSDAKYAFDKGKETIPTGDRKQSSEYDKSLSRSHNNDLDGNSEDDVNGNREDESILQNNGQQQYRKRVGKGHDENTMSIRQKLPIGYADAEVTGDDKDKTLPSSKSNPYHHENRQINLDQHVDGPSYTNSEYLTKLRRFLDLLHQKRGEWDSIFLGTDNPWTDASGSKGRYTQSRPNANGPIEPAVELWGHRDVRQTRDLATPVCRMYGACLTKGGHILMSKSLEPHKHLLERCGVSAHISENDAEYSEMDLVDRAPPRRAAHHFLADILKTLFWVDSLYGFSAKEDNSNLIRLCLTGNGGNKTGVCNENETQEDIHPTMFVQMESFTDDAWVPHFLQLLASSGTVNNNSQFRFLNLYQVFPQRPTSAKEPAVCYRSITSSDLVYGQMPASALLHHNPFFSGNEIRRYPAPRQSKDGTMCKIRVRMSDYLTGSTGLGEVANMLKEKALGIKESWL
jgi:hypothetical protein